MSEAHRVVVTGMGIITSNAHGLEEFEKALREGQSGIRFMETLAELKFACQVGAVPQNIEAKLAHYFREEDLLAMNEAMIYAGMAGIDAHKDAGFAVPPLDSEADWDSGAMIGIGFSGIDTTAAKVVPALNKGKVRRLGSSIIEQIMSSSVSAKLGGLLGLGNQVSTNSSACTTATESIITAYYHIKNGLAKKMLAGGVEGSSPYMWAGFDAMRVLNSKSNAEPEKASRPMSQSAAGFVPGAGGGMLFLESLESAKERKARIYAEILAGFLNCGGQRMGGSMTAPNSEGVQKNLRSCLNLAGIEAKQIDYINGHLTSTFADPIEIENWARALDIEPENLPNINSTKSLLGHTLGAAGAVESVAAILQLHKGFVHASLNCSDLHEKIEPYEKSVVQKTKAADLQIVAKSSFGFGDVNGSLIFKKWDT